MARDNRSLRLVAAVVALVAVLLSIGFCRRERRNGDRAPRASPTDASTAPPPPVERPTRRRGDERTDAAPAPAAPRPEVEGRAPLVVTVTGRDGRPAVGATVVALKVNEWWEPEEARGRTGADGSAALSVPAHLLRVLAWSGDDAAVAEGFTMAGHPAALKLEPARRLRGRVVQPGGSSVPDARVRLSVANYATSGFGFTLPARVNADGSFEFPPLPLDAFDAGAGPSVEAEAVGFSARSVAVTDLEREVAVELQRGLVVRGRLIDEEGAARGGVGVVGTLTDARAETDAAGAFTLTLPSGGDRVVALRGGIEDFDVEVASPSLLPDDTTARATLLGDFRNATVDVDLGIVRLPEGRPLAGIVVSADGAPVADAAVRLVLAGVEAAEVATARNGRFEFKRVGPDAHDLDVKEPAMEFARTAWISGVRGGDAEVRVVLTGALTVHLRFRDPTTSQRLEASFVTVRWEPRDEHGKAGQWSDPRSATHDAVRVRVSDAGTYDFTVEAKGFETEIVGGVVVSEERDAVIETPLRTKGHPQDARTVTLRLVDAETRAVITVGHAELVAREPRTEKEDAWSWGGGEIQSVHYDAPHAGPFEFIVRIPGYEPSATLTIDVPEDRAVVRDVLLTRKRD